METGPYVLGGDSQADPEVWHQSGVLKALGAQIIFPARTIGTFSNSVSGTTIDYFGVDSRLLIVVLSCQVLRGFPLCGHRLALLFC